jgi:hypothetical protein
MSPWILEMSLLTELLTANVALPPASRYTQIA